jgi:hypothetical protein
MPYAQGGIEHRKMNPPQKQFSLKGEASGKQIPNSKRGRFIFPLLALVLSLLMIELVTRLTFAIGGVNISTYRNFSFTRFPKIFVPDPSVGYKMKPLTVGPVLTSDFSITYEINEHGHRDVHLSTTGGPKGSTKPLALFLGDSQTFGEGVPLGERFSDLMRREFPKCEVQNSGVPGYGLHQMVLSYDKYGRSLRPCVVFVSLIEEDVNRTWRHENWGIPDSLMPAAAQSRSVIQLFYDGQILAALDRAMMGSYVYAFMSTKIRIAAASKRLAARDAALWARTSTPQTEQQAELAQTSRRWLQQLSTMTSSNGIVVVVVNITASPVPYLESVCKDLGLAYCDVAPDLAAADGIRYRLDPHYNTKGHSIIANKLITFMSKNMWREKPCILP